MSEPERAADGRVTVRGTVILDDLLTPAGGGMQPPGSARAEGTGGGRRAATS